MKVFFNQDDSNYFYQIHSNMRDATEKSAIEYIYTFKDTDVTDFVICSNGTCSAFDSQIMQSYINKYEIQEENHAPVFFKDTFVKSAYEIYRVHNYDLFGVWIKALRECNIRPWMSIRMNDAHMLLEEPNHLKSKYYEAHPDHWRATQKHMFDGYDKCLNYLIPDVRKYFLSYIKEILSRYDIDGLQLEFIREMQCFPVGMEWKGREVINEFLKDVRNIIDAAEINRNHKIKLSVLLSDTPSVNYQAGFDVYNWIENNLVDSIVPIPHFSPASYEMPVDEWKIISKNSNVKIGAGQQLLISAYPGGKENTCTIEMALGQAEVNLVKGADFVYLYNYMVYDYSKHGWGSKRDVCKPENQSILLKNIGGIDKISKMSRSYVLTSCNRTPITYWDNIHHRLPLSIKSVGEYIKISTGRITNENTKVIIGTDNKDAELILYHNGAPAKYLGKADMEDKWTQDGIVYREFEFDAKDTGNYSIFQIYSNIPCNIHWAEIIVTPV